MAVAGPTPIAGNLPLTATPADQGLAQAVAIAPTPQAAKAADNEAPSENQNLFVLATLLLLAVPALLLMTLLATVLTRR